MSKNKRKTVDLNQLYYADNGQRIDWVYYTKFYPKKTDAIQALRLDTELGLAEAKAVVDEIFARIERGELRQVDSIDVGAHRTYREGKPKTGKKSKVTVGKVIGAAAIGTAWVGLGSIFKLTSKYMKKKR